jgi:hypothetical protein
VHCKTSSGVVLRANWNFYLKRETWLKYSSFTRRWFWDTENNSSFSGCHVVWRSCQRETSGYNYCRWWTGRKSSLPQNSRCRLQTFRDNNLDALFVACYAPGHSAYNIVERRMAPLSHDLSGLLLPHDHFGSHLNNSGKTVDLA